jgi:hypothetical protein
VDISALIGEAVYRKSPLSLEVLLLSFDGLDLSECDLCLSFEGLNLSKKRALRGSMWVEF